MEFGFCAVNVLDVVDILAPKNKQASIVVENENRFSMSTGAPESSGKLTVLRLRHLAFIDA